MKSPKPIEHARIVDEGGPIMCKNLSLYVELLSRYRLVNPCSDAIKATPAVLLKKCKNHHEGINMNVSSLRWLKEDWPSPVTASFRSEPRPLRPFISIHIYLLAVDLTGVFALGTAPALPTLASLATAALALAALSLAARLLALATLASLAADMSLAIVVSCVMSSQKRLGGHRRRLQYLFYRCDCIK